MENQSKPVSSRVKPPYTRHNLPPRKPTMYDIEKNPSLTKQSFAKDANINTIMGRYTGSGRIGLSREPRATQPMQGDFTTGKDFLEVQNKIAQANQSFQAMPSEIRNRFQNNPGKLLNFLEDKENHKEAVKLGLMQIYEEELPPEVRARTDPMVLSFWRILLCPG